MLELIFLKVINMSWGAGIVILIVCLARFLLKRFPKYISYMLWSVVLFRLVCPMILEVDISPVRSIEPILYEYTVEEEIVLPETIVEYNEPDIAPETVTDPEDGQTAYEPIVLEENSKEEKRSWQEWAILVGQYVWILGMSVMFLRFAVSVIQMRKKVSTAIPVKENIYIMDEILSPFVMGILRPRIYLSTELSEKEQEYIILHEKFHIRRCDHIIKVIAYVALCIHWFNPLVWLSYVLFCKDMEMSCDEAVIKKMGESIRADYSASLLALATRHQIIGIPVDFGEGDTKGRIKNLARFRKIKPAVIVVLVIGVVILIVFLAFNNKSSNSDVNGLNDESDIAGNEAETNKINEEAENWEDDEIVEIDTIEEINEYMITEQTFDVSLDDWGEVTFVSCKIPCSIFTDASFFLVKDDQILYKFPHRFKDNRFGYTGAIFGDGVGAVGVRDVNFDEKDDIIIISYYESGAGPTGTVPRPYITIYLAGENEFYLAEDMIKEIEYNISGKDITIESVYTYLIDRAQDSQNERNPENILPADKVSVVEQCLTMDIVATAEEKNEIINIISNLPAEDYKNAIEYDKNSREIIEGEHLVVITSNESGDITIYGYKGSKYYSRGIIVDNKGVKSYFDYTWSEQRERRKIYEADFDKDGIEEVALIMLGGSGTGVSVERLIIFEPKVESGQVIAYEITGETLQQEIEKIYDFQVDIGNWEVIIKKNDTVEKVINWGKFSQYYVDGEFQLDYLNQIEYEILDDKIVMNIDVGIWTNKGGPQTYFQNNAGTLSFNVLYENEQFRLE